jgi:hypothetical protein
MEVLAAEAAAGLHSVEGHAGFAQAVYQIKRNLISFLIQARDEGKTVVGYGAPGKGNTLLNHCGVRSDLLAYTVDRSPHKQGWENGGYFVMRPAIFDYLREGEDLVPHAISRLVPSGRVMAQQHKGFWRAADTFKDRAELEEMFNKGTCPWMVWDTHRNGPGAP